jgi:hypothetical protein
VPSKKKDSGSGYSVVALSPKTGHPVKRPRRGQEIIVALKGPRGGIKPLSKDSQRFYKTDFLKMSRVVEASKRGNFILHEQKTRYIKKKKGKPVYRTDAKGEKKKIYETKITFAKPKRLTKPVLYTKGKRSRALDLAFKRGNYANQKIIRNLTVIKPDSPVHSQVLRGRTLKEAISNLHVDINLAQVRKKGFGVYYNIFMLIDGPEGRIKVPVSGEFIQQEFEGTNPIPVNGVPELFGRSEVKILANLHAKMARSMRYALKNTGSGYSFTSLATLEQIEKREWKKVEKLEAAGEDLKADKITASIPMLYFGPGNKEHFFINKKTRLTPLKPKYTVTLLVKYELL